MSNDQEKNLKRLRTLTLASLLLGVAFLSWWLYTGAGFFEDEMSYSWSFGPRKAPQVPLPADTVPWMDWRQLSLPAPPSDSTRIGASVYADFCQFCHGADGRGNTPVGLEYDPRPPDLNALLSSSSPPSPAEVFNAIRDGMATPEVNTQPPVGPRWHAFRLYLSPAQLAGVTAYLNACFGRGDHAHP